MAGKGRATDVAVAIVVIIGVPVVLLAGWMIIQIVVFAMYFGDPVMTPGPASDSVQTVGYGHGGFSVGIARGDTGETQWIRSTDGGRTWVASEDPGKLTTGDGSESNWTDCASDGVCYRARDLKILATAQPTMDGAPPVQPQSGRPFRIKHVIERRAAGGAWVEEARPGDAPYGFAGLVVDRNHSGRVIVQVRNGSQLMCRTGDGLWREVDIMSVADGLR